MNSTVVIPTKRSEVRTLGSIPERFPTEVIAEGSLNQARNIGVRESDTDYVVIMDDDLAFPGEVLDRIVRLLEPGAVVGLADWDFGLLAGRIMAFHTDVWEDVGGFDERLGSHMGDTKFCLDALRHGYSTHPLPREIVTHHPHERTISTWDRVWRLVYCMATHPSQSGRLTRGVLG